MTPAASTATLCISAEACSMGRADRTVEPCPTDASIHRSTGSVSSSIAERYVAHARRGGGYDGCMACRRCGSELPQDSRFCPTCGAEQTAGPQEERKVVSILFVDVVGSTAHADGADPEDVRERNQLYYRETS